VINPNSPTGNVLNAEQMKEIVKFCVNNNLILIASEALQDSIHSEFDKFVSFRKIITNMELPYNKLELFSFHSASQSSLNIGSGRSGYLDIMNIDDEVRLQLYKHISMDICSSVPGQIMLDLCLNPPSSNDEIFKKRQSFIKKYESSLRLSKYKHRLMIEDVSRELKKNQLFEFNTPRSGFTFFVHLKGLKKMFSGKLSMGEYYSQCLFKETGLFCTPGIGN
jgi:aspartate/methionine/tyrosine aminotransferase